MAVTFVNLNKQDYFVKNVISNFTLYATKGKYLCLSGVSLDIISAFLGQYF